jgi:glycosyltransferase involved in cell wall biosynthesis
MNVLYITANPYLRSTTSSLNAIIKELRPKGVEPVMMFATSGPWQQQLADAGVRCYLNPLRIPDKRHPVDLFADTLELLRIIRRERIDIIHCNEHEHYPMARLAGRLTRRPIVVTLHWNLEPGFGHWAFRAPYEPAAIQFLSRAQLEASRAGLPPACNPNTVKLLMSGLAIDEFLARGDDGGSLRASWGVNDDTVIIGTASAIKPRKHLEDFIRVVSMLRKSGLNVKGVIAGGGPFTDADYLEVLQRLITEEGLDGACRFIGNVDPVTPFFKALDICVNTSEMEILSMSMCEGMACAKPTVAYAVGGNPETVHDPSFVVPFGEIGALASRVEALVRDRSLRLASGAAALKWVRQQFDAPVLAARQLAIYSELVDTRV